MKWPFKGKKQPCFPIGPYRLGGSTDGLSGLTDLSAAELLALDSQVQFHGERILHAPNVNFLERSWDTIVGTVHDRVYKIALQAGGLTRGEAGVVTRSVLVYITKQQGKRPRSEGPMSVWDPLRAILFSMTCV
jgi:hypothetical protein